MPKTDPLIAYLTAHDAPCPRCGYNLHGLKTPTCPECSLDLHDSELGALLVPDGTEPYDPLYEFGSIGLVVPKVVLPLITIVILISPAISFVEDGEWNWSLYSFRIYMETLAVLITISGMYFWFDDLWKKSENEFKAHDRETRIKRVLVAWAWALLLPAGALVAPFL